MQSFKQILETFIPEEHMSVLFYSKCMFLNNVGVKACINTSNITLPLSLNINKQILQTNLHTFL